MVGMILRNYSHMDAELILDLIDALMPDVRCGWPSRVETIAYEHQHTPKDRGRACLMLFQQRGAVDTELAEEVVLDLSFGPEYRVQFIRALRGKGQQAELCLPMLRDVAKSWMLAEWLLPDRALPDMELKMIRWVLGRRRTKRRRCDSRGIVMFLCLSPFILLTLIFTLVFMGCWLLVSLPIRILRRLPGFEDPKVVKAARDAVAEIEATLLKE